MNDMDLSVISQLNIWLSESQPCWLCTVIETWGSAPRLPGSLMVCNTSGAMVGSLSGGCVEDDLVTLLQNGELASESPHYKIYGESDSDIERFQLPCGGTLGVLIEPFNEHTVRSQTLPQFLQIESVLIQRGSIVRTLDFTTDVQNVTESNAPPGIQFSCEENRQPISMEHALGPSTHLLIIGVCEVARYLAEFALATGYRVSICDPRPEIMAQWTVSNTTQHTDMPDDVVRQFANDSNSAIVAVSHDPRIDDMGLMDAFATNAFYIGAMGSQATSDKRRQRLVDLGISDNSLSRLKAPIGIAIHSKTPAEIAISILAEIIQTVAYRRDND